ncbi:MAG: hypothetical protein AMXMBFR33_24800 [Candidatus Xenobia bacterium]
MRKLLLLWLCLLLLPARAEGPTFVRLVKNAEGRPSALQTAITRYASKSGVTVDLVGVVHIGDLAYYQALNRQLKAYDAVLFEAVVDEGQAVEGRRDMARAVGLDYEPRYEIRPDPSHPLTAVQMKLASMLGLAYQPEVVDYSGDQFVHADMTAQEFEKSMQKRGENATTLFLRLLKKSLQRSSELEESELENLNPLALLTREPTEAERQALRRVLAANIGDVEGLAVELQGTALITGRNQRCIKVLGQQLKKGRKRVAILYGAAHMPDFDQRLVKQLKLKRKSQSWLTAWKL